MTADTKDDDVTDFVDLKMRCAMLEVEERGGDS